MKRLSCVVAIAVVGVVAVSGPELALGTPPYPSAPTGPAAAAPGQWTATGPMIEARAGHTATRLPDPPSRTWSPTASMAVPRISHTATLLLDGRVLVAGGCDGIAGTASAELHDPGAGT